MKHARVCHHCVLQEAAATAEALEAERAAKYAADEEAKQLQRLLDEVRQCSQPPASFFPAALNVCCSGLRVV